MGSVLLWFLLGGVGLYTLSKLAGGGGDVLLVKRTLVDGRLDRYGAIVRKEKFRDPLYLCWGSKDKSYHIGHADEVDRSGIGIALHRPIDTGAPEIEVGYEYLSNVPADPEARVAAMRAKVEAFKKSSKPGSDAGGPILKSFYDKSKDAISDLAGSAYNTYKRYASAASDAASFAEAVGVPTGLVVEEAQAMRDLSYKIDKIELLDQAVKKYGPIASTAAKGVMESIDLGTSGGSTNRKIAGAFELASSAALAIPVYGAFVSLALQAVSGVFSGFAKDEEAECANTSNTIGTLMSAALDRKLPIPWHVTNAFNRNCDLGTNRHFALWCDQDFNNVSHDQISILTILKTNTIFGSGDSVTEVCVDTLAAAVEKLYGKKSDPIYSSMRDERKDKPVIVDLVEGGLKPGPVQAMKRWWGLALTYMSHPKVKEVFDALGRDTAGGTIASDEQVMLVAAPYAAANGFDVDDFARELYKRSSGWTSLPDSFATFAAVSASARDTDPLGQVRDAFKDFCYVQKGLPFNAWWVQWAELSDTASTIVDEWNDDRDARLKAALAKNPHLAGKLIPL